MLPHAGGACGKAAADGLANNANSLGCDKLTQALGGELVPWNFEGALVCVLG